MTKEQQVTNRELFPAKVYYCGYLTKGQDVFITRKEMKNAIEYWDKKDNPKVWIGRGGISPHEKVHLFGVEINKEIAEEWIKKEKK